jgi:hypothetical protein
MDNAMQWSSIHGPRLTEWLDSVGFEDRDLMSIGVVLTPERLVDTWAHNRLVQVDAILLQRANDRKVDWVMRLASRVQHAKFFGLKYKSDEEVKAWEQIKAYRRSKR